MIDKQLILPCVLNKRWQVVKQLAQGGMGTVYLSYDLRLPNLGEKRRFCVVKQLRDDFFRQEDKERAMQYFFREAQVLSALSHPNIVAILDFFQEEGKSYLVMEWVNGKNLQEIVMERGQPFNNDEVIEWSIQVCEVLIYLHTHDPPVVYRDLKPSNLMIDERNQVKLVDFGIAKPFGVAEHSAHVVSQGYSPPEQYNGDADPRSDLYALGCTMFFLLTGCDPLALTVSVPKKFNSAVIDSLDQIVQRATQQNLWNRYQSAFDMKEELIFVLSRVKVRQARSISKMWMIAAAVVCFVVILATFLSRTEKERENIDHASTVKRQKKIHASDGEVMYSINKDTRLEIKNSPPLELR